MRTDKIGPDLRFKVVVLLLSLQFFAFSLASPSRNFSTTVA